MKDALIEETGDILDVESFLARYGVNYKERKTPVTPVCPSCGTELHLYGAHSLEVTSQFHHHDNPPDCILAAPKDDFLTLRPEKWDFAAGQKVREEFMQPENIRRAYAACWRIAGGKGHLPMKKFAELVKRADKKQLWAYSGIQQWTIPFMLMTLDDFEVRLDRAKAPFRFRFVIENKRGKKLKAGADVLWQGGGGHANLVKKGIRGGKLYNLASGYRFNEVSHKNGEKLIGDPGWISDDNLQMAINMIGNAPKPPKRRRRHDGIEPRF